MAPFSRSSYTLRRETITPLAYGNGHSVVPLQVKPTLNVRCIKVETQNFFCYDTVCMKPAELDNTFDFAEYFPIEQHVFRKFSLSCQISGFRRGVVMTFALLRMQWPFKYEAVRLCRNATTNTCRVTPQNGKGPLLTTILHKAGVQKFSRNLGATPIPGAARLAINRLNTYYVAPCKNKSPGIFAPLP